MPYNDQGDAYKLVYPFGWQVRDRPLQAVNRFFRLSHKVYLVCKRAANSGLSNLQTLPHNWHACKYSTVCSNDPAIGLQIESSLVLVWFCMFLMAVLHADSGRRLGQ